MATISSNSIRRVNAAKIIQKRVRQIQERKELYERLIENLFEKEGHTCSISQTWIKVPVTAFIKLHGRVVMSGTYELKYLHAHIQEKIRNRQTPTDPLTNLPLSTSIKGGFVFQHPSWLNNLKEQLKSENPNNHSLIQYFEEEVQKAEAESASLISSLENSGRVQNRQSASNESTRERPISEGQVQGLVGSLNRDVKNRFLFLSAATALEAFLAFASVYEITPISNDSSCLHWESEPFHRDCSSYQMSVIISLACLSGLPYTNTDQNRALGRVYNSMRVIGLMRGINQMIFWGSSEFHSEAASMAMYALGYDGLKCGYNGLKNTLRQLGNLCNTLNSIDLRLYRSALVLPGDMGGNRARVSVSSTGQNPGDRYRPGGDVETGFGMSELRRSQSR